MAASKRRRSDRALRPPMGSPGRPPLGRREHRQRFWEEVARGLSSEESAVAAGVSPAVGARWFRQCGGMPPFSLRPLSGRYLSFVEREEIAVLQARGCGVREIARQLRRSSSTIGSGTATGGTSTSLPGCVLPQRRRVPARSWARGRVVAQLRRRDGLTIASRCFRSRGTSRSGGSGARSRTFEASSRT